MLSNKLEKLIACGLGEEIVWNCGQAVNSKKVGRGKILVFHRIQIYPHNKGPMTQSHPNFQLVMDTLLGEVAQYTGTIYSGSDSPLNFTFKDIIQISVTNVLPAATPPPMPQAAYFGFSTSQMNYTLDFFKILKGDNVFFEISQISGVNILAGPTVASPNLQTKRGNPDGFTVPLRTELVYPNFNVNPLGQDVPAALNTNSFYEKIIPKIGSGNTGNILTDDDPNSGKQPLFNLFFVETDLENLKTIYND